MAKLLLEALSQDGINPGRPQTGSSEQNLDHAAVETHRRSCVGSSEAACADRRLVRSTKTIPTSHREARSFNGVAEDFVVRRRRQLPSTANPGAGKRTEQLKTDPLQKMSLQEDDCNRPPTQPQAHGLVEDDCHRRPTRAKGGVEQLTTDH